MLARKRGRPMTDRARVNWPAVAIFYVLACAFSWPFYWWRDMHSESFAAWSVPWFVRTSSYMAGPALAAIVVMFVLRMKHARRITLLGTSASRSLGVLTATIVIWTIVGSPSMSRLEALYIASVASVTYLLGEEFGWRGFLQDSLRPLRPLYRYILIGVMWEAWHFTNRLFGEPGQVAVRLTISYTAVILLSAAIGSVVERSRSVAFAVAIHLSVNWALETGASGAPVRGGVGFLACVVVWLAVLWRWPKPQNA